MRKNINKHILKSNIFAKKAIIRLNNLENKFCLIVNEKDKFVGTLTDGDLRRGLLKNFSINDNVHKFAYKRPIFTKTELNTQKVNFIVDGHAHLYVNGKKISRVYGRYVHLPSTLFNPGINMIMVSLNAHSHDVWTLSENQIMSTLIINPKSEKLVLQGFSSSPIK